MYLCEETRNHWFDHCSYEKDFIRMDYVKGVCAQIYECMVYHKMTIRECAESIGLSKSTIHRWIHSYIARYDDDSYQQICTQLRFNRRYRFCRRNR